jgi:hypothetical protein
MKTYFVTLAAVIVVGAATAANAAEIVTMNAIDANGVGKEIGTVSLSDSEQAWRRAAISIRPTSANISAPMATVTRAILQFLPLMLAATPRPPP